MNCTTCRKKIEAGELLKCIECKDGFHYRCVNITSAAFEEGHVQLKRTFKCDSCMNVTQRVRVTDETPVRGARSTIILETEDIMEKTGLQPYESQFMNNIMEKMMAKLNAFEEKILLEFKTTVTVLALENSKIRQELNESNERCVSLEKEVIVLKNERSTVMGQQMAEITGIGSHKQHQQGTSTTQRRVLPVQKNNNVCSGGGGTRCQRPAPEPEPSATAQMAHTRAAAPAPMAQDAAAAPEGLTSHKIVSYADVAGAMKSACSAEVTVLRNQSDSWTEVNYKKTPKKGGNKSIVSIKAVERKKNLHVWRLDKDTTEDTLKEYILNILGGESIVTIDKLKPKIERNYASFKIGVSESDYDKLYNPNMWPVNVEFCEWIWFRRPTITKPLPKE